MHTYLPGTPGQRIHDLLLEKEITQAEMAQKVGVSAATMTRYMDGKSEMPHTVVLKLSKALGVSVDFLLCNTDVPYRTNFDIDELGLTAEAASKLYTGELDPHVVSQLLTNPYFPKLVEQIKNFVDGTNSAAIASYNQVMKITEKLLQRQAKTMPHDKANAKNALIEVHDHMIPPKAPDMTMIRTSFEQVLNNLKNQADKHIEDQTKLTSDIMVDLIKRLDKRHDKPDLRQYTVDDITDCIVEQVETAGLDDDERAQMKEYLLGMFNGVVHAYDRKSQHQR